MPHMMPLHWTIMMIMINILLIITTTMIYSNTMKLKK